MKKWMVAVAMVAAALSTGHAMVAVVATFDAKDTGQDGYYLPDTSGNHDWTDAGMTFNLDVSVDPVWGTHWSGFTYSSVNDTTTAGYINQYAVYQPGTDYSGTGVYAVGYLGGMNIPSITFGSSTEVLGLYANNTTYAALDMQQGSFFSKEFEEGDWFKLTISGLDSLGGPIGSVDFHLADFTGYEDGDDKDDYLVSEWTWVDLTSLGNQVASLQFGLSSSDIGDWGMNTPAYFAIDNVTVIPEPSTLVLAFAFAMVALGRRRRS